MRLLNIKDTIIIGTAQLGTNYGISNTNQGINIKDKIKLLDLCYQNGLSSYDSAYAYKNSHSILGKWIKEYKVNPKINTKIPNLNNNINKEINSIFNKILADLNLYKIHNLLLHNAKDWDNPDVQKFIKNTLNLKLIDKFGISIYDANDIILDEKIKIIQIPGNVFNQEILLSEKINKFKNNGGEVHIRSIFIQGLLALDINSLPTNMQENKKGLMFIENIAKELCVNKMHIAILCINYLLPEAKIIIGIDNQKQVLDLLNIQKTQIRKTDIEEILKKCKKYAGKHWDTRNW